MAKEINLGIKYGECFPTSPVNSSSEKENEYFPCLHLENVEGLPSLPDEGTLTIRYRKSREVREVKSDRKSIDLDVLAITGVPDSESAETSTADALEALKNALENEKE